MFCIISLYIICCDSYHLHTSRVRLGRFSGDVRVFSRLLKNYFCRQLLDVMLYRSRLKAFIVYLSCLLLADLPSYITRFQWDIAKYPIKQSLRNIADIISKQVGQIDADLKTKSTAYNNLKGNLQNLEKKQT
jgi:hypothetical protein